VGTVIGIGGTAGAIGGMFMAKFVGWVLQVTGSYHFIFMLAGSVYFIALLIMQSLSPRFKRVEI
jgi:ACS family hexuronate transporter-like MFS transporter